MIKAVVFDLDNTLYDYDLCNEKAERRLFYEIANTFQVDIDESKRLLKNAKKWIKKQLGEEVAASHNRLLYMQNICEQMNALPVKYAMKFYDCYWNTMLMEMRPFSYVVPLFSELKEKNIQIAILTDLTAHIQYRKLDKLGLCEYVDYIVSSEEAGAEKPSSKMFDLIISKIGANVDEVLMVGDSLKKDIEGARNCSIDGIHFDKVSDMRKKIIKEIERRKV